MQSQNTIVQELGKEIRKRRLERNLSQEELADRAGVHRTYIGMIERGEKNITIVNLSKIAQALGIKTKELLK